MTGTLLTSYDTGGGSCASPGLGLPTSGGNCNNMSGSLGTDTRIGGAQAVVGTCTSASSPDRAKVVVQSRRVCTRQASSCSNAACSAPASMKACIATSGDVPCPAAAKEKHLLGSDFTLACAACACSITSGTCAGTAQFYPQPNCAGAPITVPSDVCTAVAGAPAFMSTKWTSSPTNEQCSTTPGPATTALVETQTVCCP